LTLESKLASQSKDSIQLSIKGLRNQNYSFHFLPNHFPVGQQVDLFLVDRFTGMHHPLQTSGESEYPFSISTTDSGSVNEFRFYIIGSRRKVVLPKNTEDGDNIPFAKSISQSVFQKSSVKIVVSPNPIRNKTLHFNMESCEPGNYDVSVTDLMGNKLYSSSFECTNNEFEFSANLGNFLPSGFYFLRINHKNQSQKATFIVD